MSNRQAFIDIDLQFLRDILRLPDGVQVIHGEVRPTVLADPARHTLRLHLTGNGLPGDCMVEDGCEICVLHPTYQTKIYSVFRDWGVRDGEEEN